MIAPSTISLLPVTSEPTAEIGIWIAAAICDAVNVPTTTIRSTSRGRSDQPQRRRKLPRSGQVAATSHATGVSASAQRIERRGGACPSSATTVASVAARVVASCQASVTLR